MDNNPAEIPESAITDPNQAIEPSMEVHHHPHHGHEKKTWRNYFWEFFMLFLAVFCGFLAEYQLEHTVEKDRAKELAKSFYVELQTDSINVKKVREFSLTKDSSLFYLENFFSDSTLTNVSKEFSIHFQRGLLQNKPAIFEPRGAILDLLINSGSLRYFKSKELQNMLIDLSTIIKDIRERNERAKQFQAENIDPFILKHYDVKWINKIDKQLKGFSGYTSTEIYFPFILYNPDKIDKVEDINKIDFFRNILRQNSFFYYSQYEKLNSTLQKELRKVYDLK